MPGPSVDSKGRVTIPKAIRTQLGLRTGSRVEIRWVGDHAEMRLAKPSTNTPDGGFGLLKSRRAAAPSHFDAASVLER